MQMEAMEKRQESGVNVAGGWSEDGGSEDGGSEGGGSVPCPRTVSHLFCHPSQFLPPLPSALNVLYAPLSLPSYYDSTAALAAPPPPAALYAPFLLPPCISLLPLCFFPPYTSPSPPPPPPPRRSLSLSLSPMLSLISWGRDKAAISPCQGFDMTL